MLLFIYLCHTILDAMEDFFPVLYPQGHRFLLRPRLLAFCEVVPEVPGVKSPTAVTHKTEPRQKYLCTSASVSVQVPNTKVATRKIHHSSLSHLGH